MLSFLPLKNNSVTIVLNFLLSAIISSSTINNFLFLARSLLNFHGHHQLFANNKYLCIF